MSAITGFGRSWTRLRQVGLVVLVTAALFWAAQTDYTLFHTAAEGFAIVVAALVYVVASRTHRFASNEFLLFLGNAYIFVAVLDFVHTMAYQGMGVFSGYTANTPTQLWVASRYMDALSLAAAPLFLTRTYPRRLISWLYAVVTALLLATIMWWRVFPDSFIVGEGLTPFKIASEYIVSLLLLGGILHLHRSRARLEPSTYRFMVAAMSVTILSELSFTLYTDVYGVMNFVGHILKVVAYYLLYRAIVAQGLEAPWEEVRRLNRNLEQRVIERTSQLEAGNARLSREVAERKQAQAERERLLVLTQEQNERLQAQNQSLHEQSEEIQAQKEALVQQNVELEHRAVELDLSNKELEAFSYSVSHDLRAPLRHIDGFSKIVLEDYGDRLGEEGGKLLQIVCESTLKMDRLIDDLLKLSRVTRSELRRVSVDLSALARSVTEGLHGETSDRTVELVIEPDMIANGDPHLLRIVLENLLGNAWKFTARRPSAHIEFGVVCTDGVRTYHIRDNGAGFDDAYAGKLFTPFQRLHTAEEFPGTGVGLATVQRIIRRHGGQVWAEGEVDKGAVIYFSLADS